jgi:hypothetical protein
MLVLSMVHGLVRRVVAVLDRRTEAPIMNARVNARSDEYLRWRDAHPGETELDEVLDPLNSRESQ